MNWVQALLDLYENNTSLIGKINYRQLKKGKETESIPYILLPLYHSTMEAHIEITLDEDGRFLTAEKVVQDDKLTMIPVSDASASRTSNKEPHPLCDNLKYLAKDYDTYVPDGKAEGCFEMYMEALEKWHVSDYSHKTVDAAYAYLKKGTILQDLIKKRILEVDEDNHLAKGIKFGSTPQTKAAVRFIVRKKGEIEGGCDECWKDPTLQERFLQYMQSMESAKDIDYLTGELQPISYLHSKKIRNEGDGTKLFSSNDETAFTFRGRFANKEEAVAIGAISSQKLHNALKWILRKQGISFDTMSIVTWETDMQPFPSWEGDTLKIIEEGRKLHSIEEEADDDITGWDTEEAYAADENPRAAAAFAMALQGYKKELKNTSRMILLALDTATPGRLSLVENKMLETSRYLKNIERWHRQCAWFQNKIVNGQTQAYYGVPGVWDIIHMLYGTEINGRLTLADSNRKKLSSFASKRLLSCIWDGRKLPLDILRTAQDKARKRLAYKNRDNWYRIVALTCSFVRKYKADHHKEEDGSMDVREIAENKLNTCRDRSFLYGRLLAVADRIEAYTFERGDKKRLTNAERYVAAFEERPQETWRLLRKRIEPYLAKYVRKDKDEYQHLIAEILLRFADGDFERNDRLKEDFWMGFYSQFYFMDETYKK